MKDWQGNEIKIGYIVSAYYYKHIFGGSKIVPLIEDKYGVSEIPFGTSPEFRWALYHRFQVTQPGNWIIMHLKRNEETGQIPINLVDSYWVIPQPSLMCLCIDGVSDNQEAFFQEYFKVEI